MVGRFRRSVEGIDPENRPSASPISAGAPCAMLFGPSVKPGHCPPPPEPQRPVQQPAERRMARGCRRAAYVDEARSKPRHGLWVHILAVFTKNRPAERFILPIALLRFVVALQFLAQRPYDAVGGFHVRD
jgi:hypothetical protein